MGQIMTEITIALGVAFVAWWLWANRGTFDENEVRQLRKEIKAHRRDIAYNQKQAITLSGKMSNPKATSDNIDVLRSQLRTVELAAKKLATQVERKTARLAELAELIAQRKASAAKREEQQRQIDKL